MALEGLWWHFFGVGKYTGNTRLMRTGGLYSVHGYGIQELDTMTESRYHRLRRLKAEAEARETVPEAVPKRVDLEAVAKDIEEVAMVIAENATSAVAVAPEAESEEPEPEPSQ